MAPHLCQPLRFYFPVWKGDAWSRWLLRLGIHAYDLLCGGRNLGGSALYSRHGIMSQVPGIRGEDLTGGVSYFDALTNDARLVMDNLRSAESAGAALYNYARLVGAEPKGKSWRCKIRDEEADQTVDIHAAIVVNATGAWAHRFPHSSIRLRLTKGVHVVIDRARIHVNGAVVLPQGKRILFVIPWGERLILGTTDDDYAGDPAAVRTDPGDVRYILGVVNGAFPGACLGKEDLISSWAGVRPLIAPRQVKVGTPSDVSRSHEIQMPKRGWIDVAGGKLTTYRLMAQQVVDRIGEQFGKPLAACRTANVPLVDETATPLYSGILPPAFEPEVVAHCCRYEWVKHLDDLLLRRTSWHYYHPDHLEVASQASHWMARELGWNQSRRQLELRRHQFSADGSLDSALSQLGGDS